MSDINLSIKHGRTQEEARARLADAVSQTQAQFGAAVRSVNWSDDRNSVHVSGQGFEVDAWVDAQQVHLVGNVPLLGRLFGGTITSGIKQIVDRSFNKQLP